MENEWQIDPQNGQRYRMVGHIREYETLVRVDGIEIPQGQLADYHKRKKAAEEERRRKALEEAKNRPDPKSCPFVNGCNSLCKREKCKIFLDGKCSLAIIADATGAEIEEAPARDKKCPFSIYGHCENCAMYSKGCAIVRIATATNNNNLK